MHATSVYNAQIFSAYCILITITLRDNTIIFMITLGYSQCNENRIHCVCSRCNCLWREKIELSFAVKNLGKKSERYRIEYGIDFMKSNGKASRKLFKITETDCPKGAELKYTRRHSFHDLTTRKHYGGKHTIAIVVNGRELGSVETFLKM